MPAGDPLPTVMTFPSLDEAEGALDWIGLECTEGEHWFEGDLDDDAAEALAAAVADPETPLEVRGLAAALLGQWRDSDGPRTWRVGFPA
jgi:hypothetical protein